MILNKVEISFQRNDRDFGYEFEKFTFLDLGGDNMKIFLKYLCMTTVEKFTAEDIEN